MPYGHGSPIRYKVIGMIYLLVLVVMTFTGFGQMPIFKRYYLADMPGFGWTADYYFTHYIHYLGAIFILGFFSFLVLNYFLNDRKIYQLTPASYIRALFLLMIIVTGIFRVLKNLPHVVFSPGFTVLIDTAHFGLVMIFFVIALFFKIFRMKWVVTKHAIDGM